MKVNVELGSKVTALGVVPALLGLRSFVRTGTGRAQFFFLFFLSGAIFASPQGRLAGRAVSSVGLERDIDVVEVIGSTPIRPTFFLLSPFPEQHYFFSSSGVCSQHAAVGNLTHPLTPSLALQGRGT
jgi:hypothetical protein